MPLAPCRLPSSCLATLSLLSTDTTTTASPSPLHTPTQASNVLLKHIVLSSGDMLESAGRSLESGLQSDGSAGVLDGLQRAATQGLLSHAAMGHVAAAGAAGPGAGAGVGAGTGAGATALMAAGAGAASGVEETGPGAASSGGQAGALGLGAASRLGVCAKVWRGGAGKQCAQARGGELQPHWIAEGVNRESIVLWKWR